MSNYTFAKAAIALANHGGGFILIGLTEIEGRFIEADGRPVNLDGYSQDLINGIIQNYSDPAFHCAVHIVADQSDKIFPVVVVPGNHRSPLRAKRASPDGKTVQNNGVYVRKPGPRSEMPTSGLDWDTLLERCLNNRRDELFDRIRDLISGAVPAAEIAPAPAKLDQWIEKCLTRWETLVADLPADAPERCPHGFHFFAYELSGDLRSVASSQFPEVLQRSVTRHTGWPPFWFPTRRGIAPYTIDDSVECWLGGDTEPGTFGGHDSAHSDFWRISPEGYAFLLRGYQEDGLENKRPATLFDVTLPIWRVGEVLLHAKQLATNLVDGPATVSFAAHYRGLAGRKLTSISGNRLFYDRQAARQNDITVRTTVEAASIAPNLPEIVHPLLSPLYSLFDFFELPNFLVNEELTRMRTGNF